MKLPSLGHTQLHLWKNCKSQDEKDDLVGRECLDP